jgi:methylmalonyl-CoA/ethylmalonyl-CoA epimerase
MKKRKAASSAIKGIHHLGVAVRDLEVSLARWSALLGAVPGPVAEIPERGVRLVQLRFARGPGVELLAPHGAGSPVSKFLEKRGEGLQHVAFEVEHIGAAIRELKRAGVEFVTTKPLRGAQGSLVVFLHPRNFNGVLLELRQGHKGPGSK